MQTLFEWDFSMGSRGDVMELLSKNREEFAPDTSDDGFMENLLKGVVKKREKIDDIIEKAAPDWPLSKIAIVDRNILRIGLYELLFADHDQVPPKVAINEAIELAKSFGGENSGKFINGVLGSVYREMGEPGKDQESKKKIEDIPYEKMPIEKLAGGVAYIRHEGQVYLGLVHDVFGHWTLSKGHVMTDEKPEDAVVRELKEETGLEVLVEGELGDTEYIASDPQKGKLRKQVIYYLVRAKDFKDMALPEGKGGLDDAKWFKLSDILDLNFYNDIVPIITKAVNILLESKEGKEK